MHLTMLNRFASVLLSGAFLASCGSGPMKGAFSRQLLEEVSQQVAADEVPQPRADGGGGETFAPGAETNEVLVFPVGSALLRSEDGVEYAYIFSQRSITRDGTVFPEVVQTWIFDTDDDLVAPNVVLIESIVSDDSIAVAGGQTDVTLRNDVTGVTQTNIQTDFYRLEAQYSGLAYWIVRSDVYFGSEEYLADDFRMGFYGLATPSSGQPAFGLAVYEGRAFGSYMRNILSTSTAATNRFLIGGDVELLADFDAGEVSGEASLKAYTSDLVLTDPESTVVIELADGSIESDGSFIGSNVSVKAAGTGALIGLTAGLSPGSEDVFFKGMFTGPEAQEAAGRADLVGTGYALRFGFAAQRGESEEIPEVVITKIKEDLQSGDTEQPTAKPGQNFEEDTNTTVVFPTEEEEAIVRSNGGETFVLVFEEEDQQNEKVVQTWTFDISDPAQPVADNVSEIQGILGTSLDISGSRSEVKRRDSERMEQTLNADVYLFEGSHAGFGLWVERPEEFFGSGGYSPVGTPAAARFYGLATPSTDLQAGGTASYAGTAAGAFVRDYISGTVAAADRYTIAGDIELEVDFGSSTIGGSAVLQAYTTSFAATSPVSRVSLGLVNGLLDRDNVSFAGSVEITAGGPGVLNGLTPGLTPDRAGFSGIFSGPKADEAVGRAEFRTGMLALQFGFLAARENEIAGITPSVLSATRTSVDAGTTIPQPPAGSESFAGETANDLIFPSGGGAVIRSKDGSEYAYVFKQGSNTRALTFTVSEPGTAAAAKARALRVLAGEGYSVAGGRDPAADGYIIERRYAGLGIWAQGAADAFFGSGSYSSADLLLSIYGLATPPAGIPESVALYVGRAFGVYLKNIQQDGTAAAADRFVVSGTVEIEADFDQNALGGSVQLVAHRLTSTEAITGSGIVIGLAEASQTNGRFDGDASVLSAQGVFASLSGVTLDNSSGYSGFLAGPAADELVGEALLLAGNGVQRLEFGFIGEYFNVIPIDAETLAAVQTQVRDGDEIEQPEAGTENFDALTAEPIVFPASEGAAIVRSRDGFEYAYIFREGSPAAARTWHFAASGRNAVASRVTSIRAGLHADIEAYGLRSEVSRLDDSNVEETFDADIYVLEAAHAGSGLLVEKPAEFFGSDAYSTSGTPVGAVFYGLVPATIPSSGTAAYAGSAIGGYMRNIKLDGSVEAADRFLISGDVELIADFTNGLIGGSAALTAHSLDLSAERGTVGIGFGAAISSGSAAFSGDVWIAAAGNDALSTLTAGLSPDSSSSFNGLLAGPDAGSIAGRAVLREASQALLFGFASSSGQGIHSPANPIAASVLATARTQVDSGIAIAQPTAGSESFDSATATDLTFPASGGAIVRSTDGSEYAYVFKADGAVHTWRFAVGSPSAAANVARIRSILDPLDIDASGSRIIVSRDGSIFSVDAYVFEGSYAGFGLLAEEPERFFDSSSDDYQARRVAVRHYGLGSPASVVAGTAVYSGKAAGGYMRNIKPDGTVAADDRFVISGTVALTADFGNSTIMGSADLIAHSLDISETRRGEIKIGISGSITDGDVDILTTGTEMLIGLTAGLSADEGSGLYSSLIAGPTAQQLAGSAEFRAGNQGLLFGFIAFRETSNIPSSPIAAAVLADVNEKVDNRDSIAVPFAGSEKFATNTSTANDVVMQNDKGSGDAVIRSKDGSEYAFVFKRFSPTRLLSWRFVSSRPAVGADIAKIRNILDSADIRATGSQAQVRSRDDIFSVNAFIFEQSYSGAAILINRPEVFFDSGAAYVTPDALSPAFAYGLRPAAEISSGFGSYIGKAFGTYISGIADGVAQGANRYLVSGDVVLAVDFRSEGIQGSINLGAYDLSLNQAVGAAEIEILDTGVGLFLEELASPFFYEISSMTGVLSGIDDSRRNSFEFGAFGPQAGEISGFVHAHGTSSQLTFGFVATAPAVEIASSPITDAEALEAITVSDGPMVSQPQADHENFGSLTGSAFFPNNPTELLGRSRNGEEFYYSYLFESVGFRTDENKLAFSNISVTGECASLTELARGEGNDCTGINNASADEVFAFELSYYSFPLCIVTNAMTSKYANGDICSLDDIAIDFAFTMGGTSSATTLIQWFFAPGSKVAADNAESIKARLGAPAEGIDVIGTRTIDFVFDSRDDSARGLLDAYFFEADYVGFGLFIFRDSDAFFGTGTYNMNRAVRARYYGLQAPAFTSSYTATYEGPAAGAYMRDIAGSGTERTVAATDRYIVTGDVELQANFATGEIAGSADLIARDLNISNANLGEVRIGLTNGSIEDSFFSGDVSIASQGTNAFSALTQGLAADNISGFRGLIAGTGAQEIAGEATFRRNNVHLLHFGFVAPSTTTTVPSWVIATELLEAAKTKLDAGDNIAQPEANNTDVFGSDTPTANTLTFPVADGALVRSPNGSEYALLQDALETVGFNLAGTSCELSGTAVTLLNDDTTTCQGTVGTFTFALTYASGSVACVVGVPGQLNSKYSFGDTCELADTAVVLTEVSEAALETVGFNLAGTSCELSGTAVTLLNDDTTTCQGTVGTFRFALTYASGSVTCVVGVPGQLNSKYNFGDTCELADTAVVLTEVSGGAITANIWRFGGSPPQAVADNASNINTIIDSSDIRVLGARSNVSKNDDTLDVDAYILEGTYAGFGIWAENPEDLFDATDGSYTADELSINFYGMATPAASIPSSGSASYSGKTFGIHMRDTNTDSLGFRFLISSDIEASADFTDRSVSMTFGTISAYELDYTPTTAAGTAQLTAFDVSITANSPDITGKVKVTENTIGTGVLSDFTNPSAVAEGTISGILAGPSNDEMAGTASLTEGGDILKLGFIASKQ